MLLRLEKCFDRISDAIGYVAGVLMLLMLVNVFYDAIMRYLFRSGSIALQELEWHFFSAMFLLGIAYALKEDGHVRVDIIYDRLTYFVDGYGRIRQQLNAYDVGVLQDKVGLLTEYSFFTRHGDIIGKASFLILLCTTLILIMLWLARKIFHLPSFW